MSTLQEKNAALLFQEQAAAEMWDGWGMEAYCLNQKKKPEETVQ